MTGWGCGNFYTCTLLEDLINDWANDVIVLEFDFVPMSDSIVFEYVFGSEEYPEFVYAYKKK